MRILWLMKKYLDVAVDKSARIEILRSLRRMGHDPLLLTGFKEVRGDYGLPGAIEYLPTIKRRGLNHASFLIAAMGLLAHRLATWRPDVVIMDANTCIVGWPWHLARRFGAPLPPFILDIRSIPVECRGAFGWLEERLFAAGVRYARRWMDGITVITPFMRETLVEQFGLDAARVGVWSSAVSLDHFDPRRFPAEETAALRRELGLTTRFVFLYHGTLSATRGIDTAIRALAALGERAGDVSYLIVGRGAARAELQELAKELSLDSRVVFHDAVPYDEIPRYVAVADAGMVPWPNLMGWRVGSPLKLMEYLGMGRPALVTDIEAHRGLLGEVPFAVYGGAGDVEGWSRGLLLLRDAVAGEPATLSAAARRFAEQELGWDRQAERLVAYLEGVRAFRCSGIQVFRRSGPAPDAPGSPHDPSGAGNEGNLQRRASEVAPERLNA